MTALDIAEMLDALGAPGAGLPAGPGLLGALFVAGLFGGATHCIGMCAPFVLAQSAGKPLAGVSRPRRLLAMSLLPYHLGRITTYTALGAVMGGLAGLAMDLSGLRWIAVALLLMAGVLFVLQALRSFGARLPNTPHLRRLQIIPRTITRVARPLYGSRGNGRGYFLGFALGFLPCGMVYAALMGAASGGGAAAGALGMAAFGAGTVPALAALAITGRHITDRWPQTMRRFSGAMMAASAVLIAVMAYRWMP